MNEWTAEITNDPKRDYELYVELLYKARYIGRIHRADTGAMELEFYEKVDVPIPADWLKGVIDRALAEI